MGTVRKLYVFGCVGYQPLNSTVDISMSLSTTCSDQFTQQSKVLGPRATLIELCSSKSEGLVYLDSSLRPRRNEIAFHISLSSLELEDFQPKLQNMYFK